MKAYVITPPPKACYRQEMIEISLQTSGICANGRRTNDGRTDGLLSYKLLWFGPGKLITNPKAVPLLHFFLCVCLWFKL